jgi:hypothetical protein
MMDIEVEMLRALVISAIGGEAAAAVFGYDLPADGGGDLEHFGNDREIGAGEVGERGDVFFGDDDDVNGPIGLGVMEGEDVGGLNYAINGDAAGEDLVAIKVHAVFGPHR